jgi:hypothetical protein
VVDVITYRVTAIREADWWSLVAVDVQGREVASQSRRLDQSEAAIREAIALVLDVDDDAFDVHINPDLSHVEVSGRTLEALEVRRALAELTCRARRQTPAAVAELRQAGLTVRAARTLEKRWEWSPPLANVSVRSPGHRRGAGRPCATPSSNPTGRTPMTGRCGS